MIVPMREPILYGDHEACFVRIKSKSKTHWTADMLDGAQKIIKKAQRFAFGEAPFNEPANFKAPKKKAKR